MSDDLLSLLWLFLGMSLLAVGGGNATLPEIEHQVVHVHHWMSAGEFVHVYSLGQLAPGPSTMYTSGLGYVVAGVAGGIVAGLAFLLPSSLLMLTVGSAAARWRQSPWKRAVSAGLAPVTIGLMAAGTLRLAVAEETLARGAEVLLAVALALAVAALAHRTRISPALLVLGAGATGTLTAVL
jgi:chromate transporter